MTRHRLLRRSSGAAALLLALGLPGPVRAADEVLIGMSAAFTGPSRGLGIELYRGSQACFADVNARGGVHGRNIRLLVYDDGYNPNPAIENTLRLIERDDAFLLFGYVGTPTVTRVLPLLKRHSDRDVFLFFPFTGAEPQRQPPYAEYVFNLRASYHQETAGLVDHFVAVGRKRIGVFYQIDAYGRSGWEGVRAALKAKGLRMAAEATYRRGTPFDDSLRAQVELLRKADVDAVISVGAYAACAAFIRDARDAGWDVPIANVSFVGSENLLSLLLEAGKAAGKDYTADLINSQVVPCYNQTELPAVEDYRALMKKYDPPPPRQFRQDDYEPLPHSFVSFEGFLNARLLVQVLDRLGPKPERRRIREVTEGIKGLDLGIGEAVSFGPQRHQALDTIYYTVVQDGRFVLLDDWKRWRK
jgi:ABC-type branched-subunit amino acid transport system substrate-binding protein